MNAVTEPVDNLQSLTSLTVLNATAALERGYAALKAGQTVFDLRHVLTVDSVAVSVMLSWQRAAQQAGVKLELKNLPPALQSLTKLYGVCSLLFPTDVKLEQDGAALRNPAHDEFSPVKAPESVFSKKTQVAGDSAAHHHH
ncbi:ABC-type transporter Mla maintaining outer membrane lipid asymmetry, MlaB component, contains STAS domain [Duganella sacchari]|uniref:ABC-type transporter Mla maintaining outer membrane lipid asymmetry, MlaB component, contains STAS domain n=1 Tax=Duganella sacchari TaxID=551987 RepID=A0A1M7MSC8_9BURK|nr:STAS domain-containing protein [Duganella sacchari]SHM93989.1 ABC-type transporter Mla maintaining outer membrane lipid asymmetry, MlaB component, contains STAS domain [Duganella sacchari]